MSGKQLDSTAAADRRLARLAFDLHDGPLQELVLLAEDLRMAAGQIESVVPEADRARVRGRFQDLEARLASLEEGLREIAQGSRSASFVVSEPIEETVRAELDALAEIGVATDFQAGGEFDQLTDSQKIALFRVVQEGLTNVRKHSGAHSVSVNLTGTEEATELTIRDDGRGFDVTALGRDRLGLAGVEERVRLLGGSVDISSTAGKGATLSVRLPRWRPTDDDQN